MNNVTAMMNADDERSLLDQILDETNKTNVAQNNFGQKLYTFRGLFTSGKKVGTTIVIPVARGMHALPALKGWAAMNNVKIVAKIWHRESTDLDISDF